MNWLQEYYEAFDAWPFVAEPTNDLVVEDENGILYKIDEPEQVTLDRIRRSKEAGRNLFFEELERIDPYTNEEAQY